MTAAAQGTDRPDGISKIRVVLVEDHAMVREQLALLLSDARCEVVAAVGTVSEGLAAVLLYEPDLAVIDNNLPDGRGIDLCAALNTQAPQVRVLIHTGTLDGNEEQDALAAGATGVVLKSIRGDTLLQAIRMTQIA